MQILRVIAGFACFTSLTVISAAQQGATPPYVNVRDFGAQGDGKTDDTAAIRKALDSLPAEGGVVYFPAGHYLSASIPGKN
jgi:polygalacturonase